MYGAHIWDRSYIMSIGACTSIGIMLTIIRPDVYLATMSTDFTMMEKLGCY